MKIWTDDCLKIMNNEMAAKSVDVVITSPPYNLKIKYNEYQDNKSLQEYLEWLDEIFQSIKKVLKDDGSFFFNFNYAVSNPWVVYDVAAVARKHFTIQNEIIWVKSIFLDKTHGHFKPIRSNRFLNHNHERVFHFTKNGDVNIDRLAIGVPYVDKFNFERWKRANLQDKKCNGNTWFIPYETIHFKIEKGNHPAIFPIELPKRCIKLHGIKENMNILDPFVGIGTTLVAIQELSEEFNIPLNGMGIDIDSKYIEIAKSRLK